MTFTRRSDGATIVPMMVVAPWEQSRPPATVARRLAQSAEVRVTYTGTAGPRTGTLTLLFDSYAAADAAGAFFSAPSLFEFDGLSNSTGTYSIVDGYIVETADTDTGPYALLFAVTGESAVSGTEGAGWSLRVTYTEVPE